MVEYLSRRRSALRHRTGFRRMTCVLRMRSSWTISSGISPLILWAGDAVFDEQKEKIRSTSFLDKAFIFQSALRFGTCILVQDVETTDPVMNPILNHEYQKTGGRVLVRLGAQEIDFSIVLHVPDDERSSCKVCPDLCSRVTFVNFTVTPSSLESQCLSAVLKVERPDIDAKRTAAEASGRDVEVARAGGFGWSDQCCPGQHSRGRRRD